MGCRPATQVRISGIAMLAMVNGPWKVTRIDARQFSLDGSTTAPGGPTGDWVRRVPTRRARIPSCVGHVVRTADVPDCTGTVTGAAPNQVVDATKTCQPWRVYRAGELRAY